MNAAHRIPGTGLVWSLMAAALVTTTVACTSSRSSDGGESASSCAYLVEYQNQAYSGAEAGEFTIGDKLGTATLPPCDDTPNDDGPTAPTSTTAYAIEGVDPSIAIAVQQASDDVIFINVDSGKRLPEIKRLIRGS